MRGALSDYTGVAVIRRRLCMLDRRTNGWEGLRSRSESHSHSQQSAVGGGTQRVQVNKRGMVGLGTGKVSSWERT